MKTPEIVIQPAKRLIRAENVFSSCLITGTEKKRRGYGNGDCILIDFDIRLFAVADAAERDSQASRSLLERLVSIAEADAPAGAEAWRECVNRAYAGQPYQQKTTLSGIVLAGDGGNLCTYVIHGGDSSVMVVDEDTQRISYQTAPDMNFAGRSTRTGHVIEVRLESHHTRIIIASDGLTDLLKRYFNRVKMEDMPDDFFSYSVDEIAGYIEWDLGKGGFEHDDIGLIVINPFEVSEEMRGCVMLGGTTPAEEAWYRTSGMVDRDQAVGQDSWPDWKDRCRSYGIVI